MPIGVRLAVGLVLDALDGPLQHAAVLAEARPQEPAVVAAAEPVDEEHRRHLGLVGVLADVDPVLEVVADVVAEERQHRHRVAAHGADLALGGGGLLGTQGGADEHAVLPVAGLGDQRHRGLAAAAEQDRRDRHALRVVPLRRQRRALRDRGAVARVRVRRLGFRLPQDPVVALPVDQVVGLALQALPPHVAVVGLGDVGEDGVARRDGLHRVGVGVPVGARRDAEEAELGVDGVEPAVLAEPHPGDVVADGLGAPAGDGRLQHREVGLAARRRERRGDEVRLVLRARSA